MRVFVSSTVYDLVDVRSEIESLLRELKLSPVMSDEKLSEFLISHDANSIQTCLINVASSDEFIIVLDKRYGPRLGKAGFPEDISATHLEYREAVKNKKPIHFYVRDKLEADFTIYRKNPGTEVKLSWVHDKKDEQGLFSLLEEHRTLANDDRSNWYQTFSSSRDLKDSLRKKFEPIVKPRVLIEALSENRFPIFAPSFDADWLVEGFSIKCIFKLENISLSPAFDFTFDWVGGSADGDRKPVVLPGAGVTYSIVPDVSTASSFENRSVISYRTAIGVRVEEEFATNLIITQPPIYGARPVNLVTGARSMGRKYFSSPLPEFQILPDTN